MFLVCYHSSILAWIILWTEEAGQLQSAGSQRVRHNWSDIACMYMLCYYYCYYSLSLSLTHTHTHTLQRKIKTYFLCKHPFPTGSFSYFEMWSLYPRVSAGGVFCPSVAEATLNAQHSWQWLQQERQNAARPRCLAPYTKPSPLSAGPLHSLLRWGIWDTGFWLQLQPQGMVNPWRFKGFMKHWNLFLNQILQEPNLQNRQRGSCPR